MYRRFAPATFTAIGIFLLTIFICSARQAAAFTNGANAIDLIGQYVQNDGVTPDYTSSAANDAPGPYGLAGIAYSNAIDYVNHRLFLADAQNNRVLVFNLNSSNVLTDKTPDFVLGQNDFFSQVATSTQSGMSGPGAVGYDSANQRLFVVDSTNNRVLVFDVASITNGENAINVLGQTTFTDNAAATTQSGMNFPTDLGYDSDHQRLFVSSLFDSRVTVYDVASITNGENAVNVLGQTTYTGNASANTQAGMSQPRGVLYATSTGTTTEKLYVAQSGNHRVTVYDVTSITNGENAINVLGQTTFTAASAANSQSRMSSPIGMAYDFARQWLYVAQSGNHRVTVYDVATTTDGENAINVLGQSSFTASASADTQSGMSQPLGLGYDSENQRLYVNQTGSHRVSIFDVASITNGENAIDLIGHYVNNDGVTVDYTEKNINDSPGPYGIASTPSKFALDAVNHRLFITDRSNNRVLVFNLNSSNQLIDKTPDNVLGQLNLYSNVATATQSSLNLPTAVDYDSANQRLFVTDSLNARIMVYDVASITDGENAVNVLGQTTFTARASAITQGGLSVPSDLVYDSINQRLFVADSTANRVVAYDVTSITNGENAINVLGQTTFTASTPATTQSGLKGPSGLEFDPTGQRLFVLDKSNNRVVVFDTASIADGENAINVLGQTDFVSSTLVASQSGLFSPLGMAYDEVSNRLFVGDTAHRVLVFDVNSVVDGEDAVGLIGKTSYTDNGLVTSQSGTPSPTGFVFDSENQRLYVGQGVHRISIFDVSPVIVELASSIASSTDESAAGNFPKLLVFGTSTATSTVQLDITGGTASSTADYSSTDPILINIPAGIYDGTLGTAITITAPTLTDDSINEVGGETITFSLINPQGGLIGDANASAATVSALTYTITDDDAPDTTPPAASAPTIVPGSQTAISGISPVPWQMRPQLPQPQAPALAQPQGWITGSGLVIKNITSQGRTSLEIKIIQQLLNSDPATRVAAVGTGSPGKETNFYGPATKAAVQKFQLKYGIVKSSRDQGYGVVGPKTRAKMNELLKGK